MRTIFTSLMLIISLCVFTLRAQTPLLLKDGWYTSPDLLTNVNGTLFFTGADETHGEELWKSDGTAAGTVMIKDIYPGSVTSNPSALTNVNGTLFFAADVTEGNELWKSDGTSGGTVIVKDIKPGTGGSDPYELTNVNGILFFSADNGTDGRSLWKSNGTAAGTTMVKSGLPGDRTNVNGTLFFVADDGTGTKGLWKSDGTAAGTVWIKTFNYGLVGFGPHDLTNVNGTLFFFFYGTSGGEELWKSDGTTNGTVRVTATTFSSSSMPGKACVNNVFYFIADDLSGSGLELWKSDGTQAGTMMVKDINPGSNDAFPNVQSNGVKMTAINGSLFFPANDGIHGKEMWKSDGTAAGTVLISDINQLSFASSILFPERERVGINGTIYFGADDGITGIELWKSNGTAAGTVLVKNINSGDNDSDPDKLTDVNGTLFFVAYTGTSNEGLWVLKTGTGIPDKPDYSLIRLFPNPNKSLFTVDLSKPIDKPVQIKIVNMLGETIFYAELSSQKTCLDLSGQPTGVYSYVVQSDTQILGTGKIILE